MFYAYSVLKKIRELMGWNSGGIYKRLDQTRELKELLHQKAPAFMRAHPWVDNWLDTNDDFLCALEQTVPVDRARFPRILHPNVPFPRPRPVTPVPEPASPTHDISMVADGVFQAANSAMWKDMLATFQLTASQLGYRFTQDKLQQTQPDVLAMAELGQAVIKTKLRFMAPLADLQWSVERGQREHEDITWCEHILKALSMQGIFMASIPGRQLDRVDLMLDSLTITPL
jgi:hypothetical protein